MKIGLIVYSHTGNTLSVAKKLEEALHKAGHNVTLSRVEPVNDNPQAKGPIELKSAPDVSPFDVVIFASPVRGFSLAMPMKTYLEQIAGLNDKKVYCYVTQQLKKPWLGGNHAVKQIKAVCNTKGGDILKSGVINWSAKIRDQQINTVVQELSQV
jgi:flavodoxin